MFILLHGEFYKLKKKDITGREVHEMILVLCSTCHNYTTTVCKEKREAAAQFDIAFNCKDWVEQQVETPVASKREDRGGDEMYDVARCTGGEDNEKIVNCSVRGNCKRYIALPNITKRTVMILGEPEDAEYCTFYIEIIKEKY